MLEREYGVVLSGCRPGSLSKGVVMSKSPLGSAAPQEVHRSSGPGNGWFVWRPVRLGRAEGGSAVLALVLYVLSVALAETAAAELLLAGFICSLLLVFALDLLERDGPRP
ncbi:hypothetical protein [Kribbella sp. NPDC048928]|uniref:hypothetical protein n=1 Tax=Kribbella sp. NPDC048928 TaxID=3364111 RepID=UPI0037180CFA